MQTRIFLFQILGIIALVFGYFLSDQPDSLSFMSFNPNPLYPNVITKPVKNNESPVNATSVTSKQNSSTPKSNEPKYVPLELMMPEASVYSFCPIQATDYSCVLSQTYCYLFFEEINPPPPKLS